MVENLADRNNLLKTIRAEKENILTPEYRYALDIIAERMYNDRQFIRELIQNADDSGSKKILVVREKRKTYFLLTLTNFFQFFMFHIFCFYEKLVHSVHRSEVLSGRP